MISIRTIALVLPIICLAVPAWADFQAAEDAFNREDYETALREWRPLAEQGNARAQYNLGLLYHEGQGVPQDYIQARRWYTKAAEQGDARAQCNLGVLYDLGQGGAQDDRLASVWFRRAADQGAGMAQIKLGLLYKYGGGVPQDYAEAHKWFNLAAANGEKSGAEFRDDLAKRMTSAQIAEAQKLAREWKARK